MELSPKLKLAIFSTSSHFINLNNNFPFNELLLNCSDEEKDMIINLNIEVPNIFRFLYFNMKTIHKILYDNNKVIKIDKTNFDEKFINYFNLTKLIEDEEDEIVNYEYEIDIIEDLNNQKSKGIFYDLIIGIIIIKLIENYRQTDIYKKENDDSLNKIENKHLENLKIIKSAMKEYEISYNLDNIKNEKLDKLYIVIIINALLNSGKIEEKNDEEKAFFSNFMEQLDLKNVEITQLMKKELDNFFGEEENKIKYNILNSEDLFNKNKINFYYNLFKYIFKDNFYISQNNFLSELRINILNILKKENEIQMKLINNSIKEEKFEYVINFITYSKFFYDNFTSKKLDNKISEKKIPTSFRNTSNRDLSSGISSEIEISSSNINKEVKSSISNNITPKFSNEEFFDYEYFSNINDKIDDFYILKFVRKENGKKKEDKNGNKKDEVTKQIIHFNDKNDEIFLNMDKDSAKLFNNDREITNIIGEIINKNKIVEEMSENEKFICSVSSGIGNLIINEIEGDIKYDKNNNIIKLNKEKFGSIKEIPSSKEIITTGLMGFLMNYYENGLKGNNDSGYIKLNFHAITKISDNIYAFVSNYILDNSQNKLVFYDQSNNSNTQEIVGMREEKGKYSFNIGNNALYLIDIDDKNKILLCACKRYVPGFKNGILIIKIEIDKFKTKSPIFNDTFDFEVNCFCKIYENKKKSFLYILVGGFEVDKRIGMVKLYRISYKNERINLEFIQDAIEDFDGFNGLINNIVKAKNNERSIIISCFSGTDYIFDLPETDDYIDILEGI